MEKDTKKILTALAIGAAAGVALGILLAPAKGEETRQNIADKGEDITDELKHKFNAFMDGIKETLAPKPVADSHVPANETPSDVKPI